MSKMSAEEAAKYDKLRARIKEISTSLGRYKPLQLRFHRSARTAMQLRETPSQTQQQDRRALAALPVKTLQ
jgi:hypothetical protein